MKALALLLTVGASALSLPPLRVLIEQSMVWHMLVQMPLLVAAGAAWSVVAGERFARWNHFNNAVRCSTVHSPVYWSSA